MEVNVIRLLMQELLKIYKDEYGSVANNKFKSQANSLIEDLRSDVLSRRVIEEAKLPEFNETLNKNRDNLFSKLNWEKGVSLNMILKQTGVDVDSNKSKEGNQLKAEMSMYPEKIDFNKDIARVTEEERYRIGKALILPENRGKVYEKATIIKDFDTHVKRILVNLSRDSF